MNLQTQIATHFRQVHFGGNWTSVNLKDQLNDIDWKQATKQVDSFNTIAKLSFHINYYVEAILKVLQGKTLDAHDKYSFDCPPIQSQEDWEKLRNKVFADAETFAALVEQLPDNKLWEDFSEGRYGNYYRNLAGVIEHTHYHLAQIVIVKKLITN